jgi:MFS family permease
MVAGMQQLSLSQTKQKTRSIQPWIIWFCAACFLLFQFFLQLSAGVIFHGVKQSFSLTNDFNTSLLLSSYYYIYVISQAPAGLLVDRFGPRYLLSSGAILVAIGCFGFASTSSFTVAMISRLLQGAGASFAFVSCMNLIKHWFPPKRFAFMTSLTEMFGMFGAIIGSVALAVWVKHAGWQTCTLFAGVIAFLFGVLLWYVIRDNKQDETSHEPPSRLPFFTSIRFLTKQPLIWLNALYSGLVFGVISVFVALWGVPFFVLPATMMTNMSFIGAAIGCPIIGFIDSHTTWRKKILITLPLIGSVLGTVLILHPTMPKTGLYITLFLLGVCLSSYLLNFVIANQLAHPQNQATSIGFVNMISVGTAPLLQPLIGWLLDHAHRKQVASHHFNILHEYQSALWLVPLMLLTAAVIGYFLPNNQPKH